MAGTDTTDRLGLVLSGGGAFGAFEAGVVAELEQRGIRPDVVSGTSAGALNAGAVAARVPAEDLADAWASLRPWDVARPRLDLWRMLRPKGLVEGEGLLDRILGAVGWSWILDTRVQHRAVSSVLGAEEFRPDGIDLAVAAVDIADGSTNTFVNRRPPHAPGHADYHVADPFRVEHLLASSAVPLLFRPVDIAGREYWDGGVIANTPLSPAIHFGADRIIIVKAIDVARPATGRRSLGHAAAVLVDTLFDHVLRTDLKLAAARNRLEEFRNIRWMVIEPDPDVLTPHLGLDFGARARSLVDAGRRTAADALDADDWWDSFP